MKVTHKSPAPAAPAASWKDRHRGALRRGFTHPESARLVAIAFAAEGFTAADVREDAGPGDRLLAELADAMDALAAGAPDGDR